jgi:hypothetical protein
LPFSKKKKKKKKIFLEEPILELRQTAIPPLYLGHQDACPGAGLLKTRDGAA